MGIFSTAVSIGSLEQQQWVDLSATVDTGSLSDGRARFIVAFYGVAPSFTENVRMADGRTRDLEVGHAWLRMNGREVITLVAFNDDFTTPLLGSLALETLRMAVDPVAQRLVPLDSIPL